MGRSTLGKAGWGKARSVAQEGTRPSEGLQDVSPSHRVWKLSHPRKSPRIGDIRGPERLGAATKVRDSLMPFRPQVPKRKWGERKHSGGCQTIVGGQSSYCFNGQPQISTSTSDLKQISVLGGQWDLVHRDSLLNTDLEISQMAQLRRTSRLPGGGGHDQGGQGSVALLWWGHNLTVGYATDRTLQRLLQV